MGDATDAWRPSCTEASVPTDIKSHSRRKAANAAAREILRPAFGMLLHFGDSKQQNSS
jgi:hypothetical protein